MKSGFKPSPVIRKFRKTIRMFVQYSFIQSKEEEPQLLCLNSFNQTKDLERASCYWFLSYKEARAGSCV